jgi:2-iminobutanoate/2-iminopropanoate deaminase
MKIITTQGAPVPAGHYSQAIVHGGLVFVSGQLPLDPTSRQLVDGGIEPQVHQVLYNIAEILVASGSGMDQVLKATIFIPDMRYWKQVNDIFAEHFGSHKPARAIIPCGELHGGVLIEMEVVAAV